MLSNRRGPAFLAPVLERLGSLASAGTPEEAARAELVLLAVWWTDIPDAIAATRVTDWEGRIVIDASNEFVGTPPDDIRSADLGDVIGSEHVASMLPGARVVKAFNTLDLAHIAANPRHPAGRQIVFLAGDDPGANRRVAALVEQFGFAAVNLGGLREGGSRLMQLGGPLSLLHALKQDQPLARLEAVKRSGQHAGVTAGSGPWVSHVTAGSVLVCQLGGSKRSATRSSRSLSLSWCSS